MENVIELLEKELLDAEFNLEATKGNIKYYKSHLIDMDFSRVLQTANKEVEEFKLAIQILKDYKGIT